MATYKQGILGGFSGRIGNVIGTFWKGRQVMRIRAATFNDANTLRQQEQRLKFKLMVSFINAHKALVNWGFGAYDRTMSAMNAAVSLNFKSAITGIFPNLTIDLPKVILSKGSLPGFEDNIVTSTLPNTISLDWLDNAGTSNALGTDNLMVSVVDNASREVLLFPNAAKRTDEEVMITLPALWTARQVTVYTFFVNEDGISTVSDPSQVSDTERTLNLLVA